MFASRRLLGASRCEREDGIVPGRPEVLLNLQEADKVTWMELLECFVRVI